MSTLGKLFSKPGIFKVTIPSWIVVNRRYGEHSYLYIVKLQYEELMGSRWNSCFIHCGEKLFSIAQCTVNMPSFFLFLQSKIRVRISEPFSQSQWTFLSLMFGLQTRQETNIFLSVYSTGQKTNKAFSFGLYCHPARGRRRQVLPVCIVIQPANNQNPRPVLPVCDVILPGNNSKEKSQWTERILHPHSLS